MQQLVPLTLTIAMALTAPALATPASLSTMGVSASPIVKVQYNTYYDYRHHPRYGGAVGAHGGYKVNRYGFGNYVSGPAGGFAGYPAGSAGAQIYRQKQEWKCQNVPERC